MSTMSSTPKIKLTHREQEILNLIATGSSTKQIAGKLSISENTVANHRKNMLRKRGVKNTAELVSYNMHVYAG